MRILGNNCISTANDSKINNNIKLVVTLYNISLNVTF